MKTTLNLLAAGMLLAAGTAGFGQSAIQFSTSTYTVAENAGVATLTVRRTGDTNAVVNVDYATPNGTATAGLDYTATNGTLTFAAGETSQYIVVPILNDGLVESTETFTVTLTNASDGAVVGTPTTATVRITDNDVGPEFESSPYIPSSYRVSEAEGFILLAVIRGDDGNQTASVDFATSDLTAANGVNYTATNGMLKFAPGQKVAVFTVPILNAGVKEGNKLFRVTLSNPTNQVLGAQRAATVTIVDNDPGVQFAWNRYWVQDTDGQLSVEVLRGNDVKLDPLSVDFSTSDLTATNGVDYLATNGTLVFVQNELAKTLSVPILCCPPPKSDRQFKLTLSNLTGGAVLGTNTSAKMTILDTTGMKAHWFEGIRALPDGSVGLALGGGVHERFKDYFDLYPIEVSSNLVDWVPLATLQRTNAVTNALNYTDTATKNWPVRFYRTPATNLITPFSVQPSGPYAVGVCARFLTDPSRRNRNRISTNSSFKVSVWYPAVAQAGRLPGPLLDPQIARDPFFSEQMQVYGFPTTVFVDRTPHMVEYALRDVPLATNLAPYPVLLCSPMGYGFHASLAEKAASFASHGYLVVVSDPSDVPAVVLPDGTYFQQPYSDGPLLGDFIPDRVSDLSFILDELTRWNTSDAVFAGRLDLAKVAVMGTCSGFNAAAEFCRADPRCQAAILVTCTPGKWVTPWDHFTSPIPELDQSGIGKPLLVVYADYADAANYYDFLYSKNAKDATVFQIQGASGGNIGDRGMILVQDFYSLLEPNRLDVGRDAARTIADYSLWFLNKYLKGRSDPMPPLSNYPRIVGFQQK